MKTAFFCPAVYSGWNTKLLEKSLDVYPILKLETEISLQSWYLTLCCRDS
jgi:hypothetical protein